MSELDKYDLKTGDLILFNYIGKGLMGWFTKLIKVCTDSQYSHIAMVLKDPSFIHPSLKGLYVWESSYNGTPDPQDNRVKLGVQITPLSQLLDSTNEYAFLRRIHCPDTCLTNDNLEKIHNVVYNKPYDFLPQHLIDAWIQKDPRPQRINRFFCSALVGYIYSHCGIIDKFTDWSILRPSDFSLETENIKFCDGCYLDSSETRIN